MHSYPLIHAQGFHNTFWAFSNIFHSFACPSVNCEWIVLNFVSDLELSKTEALQVISTWYHYSLIFNHVLKMKSFLNRPIIPALPYFKFLLDAYPPKVILVCSSSPSSRLLPLPAAAAAHRNMMVSTLVHLTHKTCIRIAQIPATVVIWE